MRPTTTLTICVILSLVSISGCSTKHPTATGPYAAQIEQAKRDATSEFEKQVLADNNITSDEYDEAFQLFSECMQMNHLPVTLKRGDDGFYQFSVNRRINANGQDETDDVIGSCNTGTKGLIEPLYTMMTNFPDGPPRLLLKRCLIDEGLVSRDISDSEVEQLWKAKGRGIPQTQWEACLTKSGLDE